MSGNNSKSADYNNVTRSWGKSSSSSSPSPLSGTQGHGTSTAAATGDDPKSRWERESQQDQPWDGVGSVQFAESTHAATTAVTTTTKTTNGKSGDRSNKATAGGSK